MRETIRRSTRPCRRYLREISLNSFGDCHARPKEIDQDDAPAVVSPMDFGEFLRRLSRRLKGPRHPTRPWGSCPGGSPGRVGLARGWSLPASESAPGGGPEAAGTEARPTGPHPIPVGRASVPAGSRGMSGTRSASVRIVERSPRGEEREWRAAKSSGPGERDGRSAKKRGGTNKSRGVPSRRPAARRGSLREALGTGPLNSGPAPPRTALRPAARRPNRCRPFGGRRHSDERTGDAGRVSRQGWRSAIRVARPPPAPALSKARLS
jgi:hypothetical protein